MHSCVYLQIFKLHIYIYIYIYLVLEEEVNGEHDSSNRVKFVPITFAYWARFFGPHC